MTKFGIFSISSNGERDIEDDVFDTEKEAEDYANYLRSCSREGAEILYMSNPGDYPYDEDDGPDFEVFEINE